MFLGLEIIPPIRIFVQLKEIFTCMLLIATMGAFQAFNQRTRFLLPIVYVRHGVGRPTSKSFGGKNNTGIASLVVIIIVWRIASRQM
jgi:hypothetical protein